MSVVWAVITTAVVITLAAALFYTIRGNIHFQKELSQLNCSKFKLEQDKMLLESTCRDYERKLIFREGLDAGRKTDTLYQQILKKHTNGEQYTFMINGIDEEDLQI